MKKIKKNQLKATTPNWSKLSKRQKSMLVAMDALYLIRTNRVEVESGCYLEISHLHDRDVLDDAKKVLEQSECQVCAKGAFLVSKILSRNQTNLVDIGARKSHFSNYIYLGTDSDHCTKNLLDVINPKFLHNMEIAFEGNDVHELYTEYDDDDNTFHAKCKAWVETYRKDRQRLIKILERFISNGGQFHKKDILTP